MAQAPLKQVRLSVRTQAAIIVATIALVTGAVLFTSKMDRGRAATEPDPTGSVQQEPGVFRPTPTQWAALTVQPVELHTFRTEILTEGKIAVDEDRATRIFSPYAGRVTKLLVAPGDTVQQGQPVFVVEAADSVDTQKDFVAALTALNKARSQVNLTDIIEHRMRALFKDKAMPLKDWQEAQANLVAAQNDLRSSEIALQAVRNRLRLLGKTDKEIDTFEQTGLISPEAPVHSPLSGTVLQRKVGPGQYVNAGASDSDPVFVIGDISRVWLAAFVRESDAPKAKIGQSIRFKVLAYPDRVFEAKINHVATSLDPNSRRRLVRATVENPDGLLNPEMFASVAIVVGDAGGPTPAVPLEAVIYEGDRARVWVARDKDTVELRQVKLGIASGRLIQVVEGLDKNEKIICRGSLFIDRMASAGQS